MGNRDRALQGLMDMLVWWMCVLGMRGGNYCGWIRIRMGGGWWVGKDDDEHVADLMFDENSDEYSLSEHL